ncbi:hypothetical protein [Streptomyces sp. NPDC057460]|uniref:hypothetical protein n=1 Tax=Streptomyces sp. NPDC057460 TaxID=3346141 RepID=UPI00367B0058
MLTLTIVISQMEAPKILKSSDREWVPHPLCSVSVLPMLPQKHLRSFHDGVAKNAAGLR